MWVEVKLFGKLKYLLKHSMNPRSSLTHPDHQERRWWWQTPVICYQLTLVKAPSWLLMLAHTSGSPSSGTDAGSDAHAVTVTRSYPWIFMHFHTRQSSFARTDRDTHPGNVCAQGLRHPLWQWETPAPREPARGCKPVPLGQGEGSRHRQHPCTLPEPEQCLCVLHHKTFLPPSGQQAPRALDTCSGWGGCVHEVVAYLG